MFSVKFSVGVTPCSSSSSTARLEPATAAAADSDILLRSGAGIGGLLALRFYDKYGNLQSSTAQQQAFSSSSFPEITAVAVGQAGDMGFLLQGSSTAAAAAAAEPLRVLPREAFVWSDAADDTQPGYLLSNAALVGRLAPGQHADGMPFIISVGNKHSLSGRLLPGPVRQFELQSPDRMPGGFDCCRHAFLLQV
jgi:hypothetical protein